MYWPHLTWVWYIIYTRTCRDTPLSDIWAVKLVILSLLIQFTVSPPQLSGFPLHLRYSDIQHIVSQVESTGLHLCENEHVECICSGSLCTPILQWYLCAVQCLSFQNNPLSSHAWHVSHGHTYTLTVWLYTSSLVLQFHLLCTVYGWLHMPSILFDQFPNQHSHVCPSTPASFTK